MTIRSRCSKSEVKYGFAKWYAKNGALTHTPLTLMNPTFIQTTLYTDTDGRARFGEQPIFLNEGTASTILSRLMPSGGYQLRHSPVGFRSQFHCTTAPQWVFILSGQMKIGLQDGSSRVFSAGEHFYSMDTLPDGVIFDPTLHGHWSQQLGNEPLVTLFVRG
jgi:hypothetical protein